MVSYLALKPQSNAIFGSKIKITSGEQFVPLFLVFADNQDNGYAHTYNTGGDKLCFFKDAFALMNTPPTKEGVKQRIINHLNLWMVKEYSIYLNIDRDGRPYAYNDKFTSFTAYAPGSSFECRHLIDFQDPHLYAPFYYAEVPASTYTTLKSSVTPSVMVKVRGVDTSLIKSKILMVVKAKYLTYLRACFVCDKPNISLPYDAIKLLRTPTLSGTGMELLTEIRPMMQSTEMIVEYVTSEVINSYLFDSKPNTREDVLSRAKSSLNNSGAISPFVFAN
jgi:hypothetical protein